MDMQEQPDVLGFKVTRKKLVVDNLGFTVEDWATLTRLVLEECWRHSQGYKKTGYGEYLSKVLRQKCQVHYAKLLATQNIIRKEDGNDD